MATGDQEARAIGRLAQKLSDAEARVTDLRQQLDARLSARHDAGKGKSIAQLTREAGLSRQAVYNAIKRHAER